MFSSPTIVGLLVFSLALGAGVLPLVLKFGERTLHGVVAAACGFFLGITFLHLLPELALRDASPKLWAFVLAGLLAVFFAEVLLRAEKVEGKHEGHRVLGLATFVGLSVHTLGGAIAIGLAFDGPPRIIDAFVVATLAHKSAEAFSLASVLLLAELSRRAIFGLLVAYAAVTPAGILVGRVFSAGLTDGVIGPAEGLAAGTFLYVAIAELLPEIFHGRSDRLLKVFLLLAGIAASTALLLDGR